MSQPKIELPPAYSAGVVDVAPGLAVRADPDDGTHLARYTIIHVPSGLAPCGPTTFRCADHADKAVAILVDAGVDWTLPQDELLAEFTTPMRLALHHRLSRELGRCFDPEPATAIARPCPGELIPAPATEGAPTS